MVTLNIERTIRAPLERVWSVAGNFLQLPDPSVSIVVEKEGNPDRHGAGAERIITIGNVKVHERLETIEPPRHFTYTLLSGVPVKNYHGRAEFSPSGGTTLIKWTVTFDPKILGTGWIAKSGARKVLNSYLDAVERVV